MANIAFYKGCSLLFLGTKIVTKKKQSNSFEALTPDNNNVYHLTYGDYTEVYVPKDVDNINVTFTKAFSSANSKYTICLPFDVKIQDLPSNLQVWKIDPTSFKKGKVTIGTAKYIQETDTLLHNTLYQISSTTKGTFDISAKNTKLYKTSPLIVYQIQDTGEYTVTGCCVYKQTAIQKSWYSDTDIYAYFAGGSFSYSRYSDMSVAPFIGYLHMHIK